MTDIAAAPPVALRRRFDVTSDSARARVRRRYRAEARFRYYGLIALIFTTIFLVVLIADIVRKGLAGVHSILAAARCRRSCRSRGAGQEERSCRHPQRRLLSAAAGCPQGGYPGHREPLRREDPDTPPEHGCCRPLDQHDRRRPEPDRANGESSAAAFGQCRPLLQGCGHAHHDASRTRNRHPERHHRRDHRADLRQRLRR